VRQLLQKAIGRFGYELRRKRPVFQPYTQHVAIAHVEFDFWVGDATGKEWYSQDHGGFAEHTETARLVQPGDCVLEVGAHHGFLTMLLSRLVGPEGFVLAVEPSPFNAMMAVAQIGLNGAVNSRVLQVAAGERSGRLKISQDSNASVSRAPDGIEVEARTIDEMDMEFGPFDVLKVDVEGFEYFVLLGGLQLLQRRPKLILEVHPRALAAFGSSTDALIALLDPAYRGTFVPRDARRQVLPFPSEKLPSGEIANLFLRA